MLENKDLANKNDLVMIKNYLLSYWGVSSDKQLALNINSSFEKDFDIKNITIPYPIIHPRVLFIMSSSSNIPRLLISCSISINSVAPNPIK